MRKESAAHFFAGQFAWFPFDAYTTFPWPHFVGQFMSKFAPKKATMFSSGGIGAGVGVGVAVGVGEGGNWQAKAWQGMEKEKSIVLCYRPPFAALTPT